MLHKSEFCQEIQMKLTLSCRLFQVGNELQVNAEIMPAQSLPAVVSSNPGHGCDCAIEWNVVVLQIPLSSEFRGNWLKDEVVPEKHLVLNE